MTIPFSVIGGFLGAGKTTLINRLLRAPGLPRLAILVNDFGDIAVDAALIEAHGGDTIALANGCICCGIGNDLGRALGRALDREARVERIVVEASGVANPGRIMDVARISAELEPAGTLVVVDAAALLVQLADRWIADTVAAQLACADLLFVNKLESVDAGTRAAALSRLALDYAETARVHQFEDVWPLLAFPADGSKAAAASAVAHLPFCARTLISRRNLDLERLRSWLAARDDVFRIKGWARLEKHDVRLLQYAGHRLTWTPAESAPRDAIRLVVIGRDGLPAADEIIDAITAAGGAPG